MLDTDTIIFIRSGHRSVIDRFSSLAPGEASMSAISFGELRFGAETSRSRVSALATLSCLMAAMPVSALSDAVGAEYGAVRADLQRRGELIGPNDLWIAAHARSAGLTLVTNNEREFRRVPGLAIENWAAAA